MIALDRCIFYLKVREGVIAPFTLRRAKWRSRELPLLLLQLLRGCLAGSCFRAVPTGTFQNKTLTIRYTVLNSDLTRGITMTTLG